jgi:uncharacterized protein YqhQ
MKNHNKPITRGDVQFIYRQRTRIGLDIFISIGIIYILANFFMLFTKMVFLIGLVPIAAGLGYGVWAIGKKIRETREYWKNN